MTAFDAMRRSQEYLKEQNISFLPGFDVDSGGQSLVVDFPSEHTPPVPVEGEVFFYSSCAELRVYYGEQVSASLKATSHRSELLELINFINARVFPYYEVVYTSEPQNLFTPRMYLTVDGGCDLTITTIVDYRVWEYLGDEGSDELYEYFTHYCPRLLDMLAVPIFGLLTERTTVDGAIKYINNKIIGE